MIFKRSYSFRSKMSSQDLRQKLKGEHLKVHDLDFEIMEKEGILKIIPHAEMNDEKVYTLPITHLHFNDETGGGSRVKMKSKARRTDIGGPNLVIIFCAFLLIAGIIMFISDEHYRTASYILIAIAILFFSILWYRMEMGYFDYIRKIRAWLKSHV